jgi:hypothetical protein
MKLIHRLGSVVLILGATLAAQDAPETKAPESKAQSAPSETKPGEQQNLAQSLMEVQPGPEIQKLLNSFTGLWETSEKIEPTSKFPEGGTGRGQAFFRPGPGAYSMIEDYRSQSSQGLYSARSTIWWDAKAKGFRRVWCDSTIPSGCIVSTGAGNWQGPDFVFEDEQQREGKKIKMKETYTSLTPNSFVETLDQSENGRPMKRTITINWAKAGSPTAPAPPPATPPKN